MTEKKPTELLEGAYSLQSVEDNVAYYKGFAEHYDDSFANAMGYNSPQALIEVFKKIANQADFPIADIGCGTGLVAQALNTSKDKIDGYDISHEMLDVAKSKNLYRDLYCANLKKPLVDYPNNYGSLISVGTFTLGHLGPDDLGNMLSLLRINGLICITVNVSHFKEQGFAGFLENMQASNKITKPHIYTVPIYTDTTHEHGADKTHILSFRKIV